MPKPKPKLIHVVTTPLSLPTFLTGQVRFMEECGFEVQIAASPGEALTNFGDQQRVATHAVPMTRAVSPISDARAVARLCRLFVRERPKIVHAHTPKGGLLGMIAAYLARVPLRIYHVRGLPLATAAGAKRRLLQTTEQLSCRLACRVLCVSGSLRDDVLREGLCEPEKIAVLGSGSGNGVDAQTRFTPRTPRLAGERDRWRRELGIPDDAVVLGFVGRLVRDKGVDDLIEAWSTLRGEFPKLHLVVVGLPDPRDAVSASTQSRLDRDPRVHCTGPVDDMPSCYSAMDFCVLPTYREGLPNVVLEAAAMALPVVATRVTGCVDAVVDGVTGALTQVKEPRELVSAIRRYAGDESLRLQHGASARRRVLERFCPEDVWRALYQEYDRLGAAPTRLTPINIERGRAA